MSVIGDFAEQSGNRARNEAARDHPFVARDLGRQHLGREVVLAVTVDGLDAAVHGKVHRIEHSTHNVTVTLVRHAPAAPGATAQQPRAWKLLPEDTVELEP